MKEETFIKKTNTSLMVLTAIFTVALVISNVITARTIYTGISLFGSTITLPGAVPCYAITYLVTDIVGEVWGKKEANTIVRIGLAGQIIATALIILTQFLPAADAEADAAYNLLLGQNYIFVIGSLVAYYASQSWDVFVFHKIRDKFVARSGNSKSRWIWNNASTMTSQIIDTVLFIGISFGIGFGWLFNSSMWTTLAAMMVGQYAVKFILAVIDTPFFYLFTYLFIKPRKLTHTKQEIISR